MKKIVVLLFLTVLSISVFSQKKFGHVDSNAIFDMMPEKNEIKTVLETFGKSLEDQMTILKKELETKYVDYQNNSSTWSDAVKEMKEEELYSLQQRIQNFQLKAQQDMSDKETSLLEPIYNKIKDTIKAVGEEKSLMYVFDVNTVLYVSPESVDITKDVKAKLGIK